jgi:fructokinase
MFGIAGSETSVLGVLLERFSLQLIVLTKGKEGSRLFAGKRGDCQVTSAAINIIDTVGAGDCFAAIVVHGLLCKISLDDINLRANKVAGYVCTQKGATPEYILSEIIK